MRNQFNILVIDDEEKILDALRLNLEQTGYSVATAKTGEEGLVLFNNRDFDLVLADLQLPDMQGTEVMRRLKGETPLDRGHNHQRIRIGRPRGRSHKGRGLSFRRKAFRDRTRCCC